MGGSLLLPFPCIAVDFNTGSILLSGSRNNVSVSPITNDDSPDNIPLYTKTAIFAILCILVVFVLFIYCQSSVRHYLAVNAFRTHQRQLEQQNLVLQQRATARIRELPIVEYKHDGAAGDRAVCAICLEELQDGLQVRKLPCQHLYHIPCIDPWLTSNRTCPLCKADILEATSVAESPADVVVQVPDTLPGRVTTPNTNVRRASSGSPTPAAAAVMVNVAPAPALATNPVPAAAAAATVTTTAAPAAAAPVAGRRVSGMSMSESRVSMNGDPEPTSSPTAAAAAATALASLGPSFFYPTSGAPLSPVLGLAPSANYSNTNNNHN